MNIAAAATARRPLIILAIAHVLCGLVLGYIAEDGPEPFWLAIYLGLLFSQTSLVGMWGGLARRRWQVRLGGVVVGVVYLWFQCCFSLARWGIEPLILVFVSTVAVAVVFLLLRQFLARLETLEETATASTAEGLHFTIRHLMLLTLAVACSLTLGRWPQPYLQDVDFWLSC